MKSLNEKVWGFHSWSFSNLTTYSKRKLKKEKELEVKTSVSRHHNHHGNTHPKYLVPDEGSKNYLITSIQLCYGQSIELLGAKTHREFAAIETEILSVQAE